MRFSCARIFSDHMVLQRNRPIAVFGLGPDGETVEAELLGRRARAACAGGKWLLFLPAMDARGPLELRVRCGAEEAVFSDVALGEVWLAGGQSNMELILENAKSGGAEIPKAQDPNLRYYHAVKTASEAGRAEAETQVPAGWVTSSPETAGQFSAVAYHVAKRLRAALGVPVGIVGCSWGGTSAACWVSRAALEANPALRVYFEDYDRAVAGKTPEQYAQEKADYAAAIEDYNARMARVTLSKDDMVAYREATKDIVFPWPPPMGPDAYRRPCGLHETMLAHVAPYSLRGALWYQGEEDSGTHP